MLEVSSIQGKAARRLRQAAGLALAVAASAGLGGCQGQGAIGSGEDLFHGLQGGAIAEQRPPPPGVNDPYPNLGTIPKRPQAPDIAAQQKLADQLAAQRDQAEKAAADSPLIAPPAAPPLPKPATAPDPNANRVVVDAAPAPPPVPTPPAGSKPATQSEAAPAVVDASVPSLASVPAVTAPLVSGPLPSFAAMPPPGPTGLDIPLVASGTTAGATASAPSSKPAASASAASAPAPTPPATPATPPKSLFDKLLSPTVVPIPTGDTVVKITPPTAGSTVAIDFTPGSSTLPPSATLNLRRFALAHKGVPVTITGHGEAVLKSADAQSRALDLALRRAQAIAASLSSAGIPAANLHLHADAAGQGGSASL